MNVEKGAAGTEIRGPKELLEMNSTNIVVPAAT
jgi:hypothetical protein